MPGAAQEGFLREPLLCRGLFLDQIIWAILDEDWQLARTGRPPRIHER